MDNSNDHVYRGVVKAGSKWGHRVAIEDPRMEPWDRITKLKVKVQCDCGHVDDMWLTHFTAGIEYHVCEHVPADAFIRKNMNGVLFVPTTKATK